MRLHLTCSRRPLFQDSEAPTRIRIGVLAKPNYSAYRVFLVECDAAGCQAYANKRKLLGKPATRERAEKAARDAMQKHLNSGQWFTLVELRRQEGRL
jgi:hypothetical protein